MEPRLKQTIKKEIQPSLKEKFGYKNLYMGPKIYKVVINMGLGLDGNDAKILKSCEEDIAKIARQGIGIMSGYEDELGDNGDQILANWVWEQAQKAWVQ